MKVIYLCKSDTVKKIVGRPFSDTIAKAFIASLRKWRRLPKKIKIYKTDQSRCKLPAVT